jgi:PAS domain S-box-containing protein
VKNKDKTQEQLTKDLAELRQRIAELEDTKKGQNKIIEGMQEFFERYEALFERSIYCIYLHDLNGRFLDANKAALNLLGYSKEDLPSLDLSSILTKDQLQKAFERIESDEKSGSQKEPVEYRLRRKDGSHVWVMVEGTVIYREEKPYAIQGIALDITKRKKDEEKIKSSLREKEVLLKEVHHRVKNNMQIISSLLSLQSAQTKDKQALLTLKECQNRIKSIALIHGRLYQSGDFAKVDFTEYVQSITNHLYRSYGINSNSIKLDIKIKDIYLDLNTAIPCALIINELLTNSLKHGFPDGRKGKINIVIHPLNKGKYEIIISDNGIGLPEEIDIKETESLGLHLVNILAKDQLDGDIKLDRTKGTHFCIQFETKK